jgi:alpha-N-arabinofuranosidase
LFLQPTFFPLELYRRESGDRVLDTWVRGPGFKTKAYGELDYLDVCATRDSTGRLAIGVVNRHRDRPLAAEFEILGSAAATTGKVFQILGPSPEAMNSFEKPDAVGVATRDHSGFSNRFSFEFPKHSITLLKLRA